MSRATVRWHERAIEDLADLWLESADAPNIERAAHEIDSLLAYRASSKGRPYALARLTESQLRLLVERAIVLPEDL